MHEYEKHDDEEDFINDRTEEICSHEKLSAEVIYFLVCFLQFMFSR